ncbi:ISP domain-containing protein [Byssothecium circinans]|uniref:Choline monooxygenase, chloroplastic n=1 Tax=Byssothecium circinans TaxID=147558 RepID=A0A6A5TQN3_9PLEO|nr:ISP domain-containing protein [Byssothecium circinans]
MFRRVLGSSAPTPVGDEKKTLRALPSSWYRSEEIYQLERRAIFSQRWIMVAHKLRFTTAGAYVRFEQAGFPFFLVRDRDGNINGFRNVCRHRAFPIVTEANGEARILSCKYHGWSYGLKGNLAKAPGYDEMSDLDFDKSKNNLLPIHVHINTKGFIWVNLEASEKPKGMSGDYNWKTLADNYNECYHCPTALPDARGIANPQTYQVDTKGGQIIHYIRDPNDTSPSPLKICSTFYFPNACMTVSPDFFYMMRCVPTSAQHTAMEYDVFRHKDASNEDFTAMDEMFKQILDEDKWLCNNAQKNLNAGVFVNGEMHTRMEKGPLFFQNRVREMVRSHRELEEKEKREIP